MSTLAPYHYSSLPSPHHIRLLELSSCANPDGSLTGTMRTVNIVDDCDDEDLPYVALSYRWSNDTDEELLLEGNGMIRISRDLSAALHRFRYASALRWIWVDAICINQRDTAEKSIQIPLMTRIYRGASRVMVWLGNRDEDALLLRRIKSLIRDAKRCPDVFYQLSQVDVADEAKTLISGLTMSLSRLGRLGWFTRRWVLQELASNANVVLCCRTTELPWSQLAGMLRYSEPHGPGWGTREGDGLLSLNQDDAGLRNIQLLWDLWWDTTIFQRQSPTYLSELGKNDMATLMNTYAEFDCSDNRDRIAALLGISHNPHDLAAFRVDYADSVEQTYVKFAENLVRTGHLAWLLYRRFHEEKQGPTQERILSSWVPDWRLTMVAPPLPIDTIYLKRPASGIQASKNTFGLHLLTAEFWTGRFASDKSTDSGKAQTGTGAPLAANPPFLEISWKSSLFPKNCPLDERLALVLVDLWPCIVARLSEYEKPRRRAVWYCLLLQIVDALDSRLNRKMTISSWYWEYPEFGDEDFHDPGVLRDYVREWVRQHTWALDVSNMRQKRRDPEVFARCLIFCQHESGCLNSRSVCGIGSIPPSLYDQVEVGDKVLQASLGEFRHNKTYWDGHRLRWSTYIMREQFVVPEGVVELEKDALESKEKYSSDGVGSCCEAGSNLDLVSPWAYEFIAPCFTFNSFARLPEQPIVLSEDRPDYYAANWYDWGSHGGFQTEERSIWIV